MTSTRVTLSRSNLTRAMASLARVVERKNTIPILSNVLLQLEGNVMSITATDLDIEARTEVEVVATAHGAITVDAHMLHEIARKLPDTAQVLLEWGGEQGRVSLQSGRARFALPALPPEDFPDFSAGDFQSTFTLPASALAHMIEKTAFAVSTEETRYYLNGIYLHATAEGGLRAVATDGHRLARCEAQGKPDGQTTGMPGIIIPRKTVGELARLTKDVAGDITLEVSSTKLRATIGVTTLTSKLIDGTFPDYDRVIPKGNPKRATLKRADLAEAVDRVETVSSEKSRAVKMSFGDGALTLEANSPDAGTAAEEMEITYADEPITIGFNSAYVIQALAVMAGDTITIDLADAGSPTLLTSTTDQSLLVVLMPLKAFQTDKSFFRRQVTKRERGRLLPASAPF